jgi:hypothetical protein
LQSVIQDPTKLLTAALAGQKIVKMVVINIATVASVQQLQNGQAAPKTVKIDGGGGGIENIPFLVTNADAATMFATFWIEEIEGPTADSNFLQLQYVQTVLLNFPLLKPPAPPVPLSWPHVSVATLRKTFGGQ